MSSSKEIYALRYAEAAKSAGNAALVAGNPRRASFEYKKVYLYLAEYLPQDIISSASPVAVGSGGDANNGSSSGIIQLLQNQRPPCQASNATRTSSSEKREFVSQIIRLYATTLNNLALVNLKLGRYREGISCATAVLEQPALRSSLDSVVCARDAAAPARFTDTPTGKALLRRASCFVRLSDWTSAEADLHTITKELAAASTSNDVDATVAELMTAVDHGRGVERSKEKEMMQRMFAQATAAEHSKVSLEKKTPADC